MKHIITYRYEIMLNRMLTDSEKAIFDQYVIDHFYIREYGLSGVPDLVPRTGDNDEERGAIRIRTYNGEGYPNAATRLNCILRDVLNPMGIQVATTPLQYIVEEEGDGIAIIHYDKRRNLFIYDSLFDIMTYYAENAEKD